MEKFEKFPKNPKIAESAQFEQEAHGPHRLADAFNFKRNLHCPQVLCSG
jgi:hypothetical protein